MFMMFKSIFNLILLFTKFSDNKIIHYRIIKVNGEQGCIQSNISKKWVRNLTLLQVIVMILVVIFIEVKNIYLFVVNLVDMRAVI